MHGHWTQSGFSDLSIIEQVCIHFQQHFGTRNKENIYAFRNFL